MRLPINNIALNVEVTGSGPPLLLLHGFTGSTASWGRFLPCFAQHRRVISIDLIGHGDSDAPLDAQRYRMERCVEDLLAVLATLDAERADVLGYSMGGRVALHLAAAAPARVRSLVLESASPGLADPAERQQRIAADEALADRIERDGLESFVESWQQLPLFASQAALPSSVRDHLWEQRLKNSVIGLAGSLRGMGTGRQEPLWHRLEALPMPTLLIVGALDRKYCEVGGSMAATLPAAQLNVVPNAGHTVHLEQPERFEQLVMEFLLDGTNREVVVIPAPDDMGKI